MIILRSGNIIGGGDWGINRLLPDIVNAYSKNKQIKIRSINSTRPWLHVLDVINAILLMIGKSSKNKKTIIYNLSPKSSNQVNVKKILQLIKKNTVIKNLKVKIIKNKINEKKYLQLSSNKIRKELGWVPKLNISNSLILTIKLYLSKKNDLFMKTKNQISNFFD
jgi:CDP-glucose 4,6-dehydratase